MSEEAPTYTLDGLEAHVVPELRRLARSDAATLAAHGLKEADRFQLNRLAWLLPDLCAMKANPKALPNPSPTFPTPSDMDLLRKVTRFLNPEG